MLDLAKSSELAFLKQQDVNQYETRWVQRTENYRMVLTT